MAGESLSISDISQSETTPTKTTVFLRSKVNPEFQIEVGPSVINYCSILKNIMDYTDISEAVEVDMSQKELESFVELHNHFSQTDSVTDKDEEWTNAFFTAMSDDEFKELCWKADYLDSQRFLEAAGDFILAKLEDMEIPQIQNYLNIIDDYTSEERKIMEKHPLEFFANVSSQPNKFSSKKCQTKDI